LTPEIKIDTKLELNQIDNKLMRIVKQFAPFGPGNMTPVFMSEDIQDSGYSKRVGEDKSHLRITVTQNGMNNITGIGFGMGDKFHLIENKKLFKAVYSIDENVWNGTTSIQLKLKDIK